MARTPKLYAARGLFAGDVVCNLLGLASHIRQADHYVMATTKAEAAQVLSAVGYKTVRPADIRVATGHVAQALSEAGIAEAGDVIILRQYDLGPVVRLRVTPESGPVAEIIGRTVTKPGSLFATTFTPTIPLTATPLEA